MTNILCIQGRPFFDSVVLVVRNPFHAMVSEWNRELSTKYGLGQGNGTAHTNVYGREYFRELLKINLYCLYMYSHYYSSSTVQRISVSFHFLNPFILAFRDLFPLDQVC